MKSLRPAAAAVILTALLAVPAHADHRRFGGFFVEPFFVPLSERPLRGRLRQQDGYPVALVRQRLRGIGFSQIGQFDIYPGSYGVTATDPGGVRVNLVIDRWSGDIVRARIIEAGPAVRPYRPPAVADRGPRATRKTAALRVPPLPRPAPERMTRTVGITPSAADRLEWEKTLPEAAQDEDIVTSSIDGPVAVPEIDPIVETTPMSPPEPEATSPEPEAPVEIASVPKLPAIAEPDPIAEAVTHAPKPARPVHNDPVTALQGERFDPADARGPITVY